MKNRKPGEKQIKLFDGGGLYLLVPPGGGKYWRLKYSIDGREKVLALGTYPEVSLADAREKRDAARKQLKNGIDPGEAKKAARAMRVGDPTNSFEVV